jgi:hypothetical protein
MPAEAAAAETGPMLHLTWTVTHTYTGDVPLSMVAAAAEQRTDILRIDPAVLHGLASARLAYLLEQRQEQATGIPTDTEVEILQADIDEQPRIAELAENAWQALQDESDADQPTPAGRALAALLTGLRREGITDR